MIPVAGLESVVLVGGEGMTEGRGGLGGGFIGKNQLTTHTSISYSYHQLFFLEIS